MNRWETGRRAEQLAAGYLRARGYRIWKTNWRWGKKELDLVATYRDHLVIVEVKAMVGNQVNHPAEVVDESKQRNMIRAAEGFIRIHKSKRPTRFDVIAVIYQGAEVKIEHLENAFTPGIAT
jgi:putative endonuclease